MTTEQSRREFEAWVNKHWALVPNDMPNLLGVHNQWTGDWAYTMAETSNLFSAWQASRTQLLAEIKSVLESPECVEEVAAKIQHHNDSYGGSWFEQREAVKNDFRQTAKASIATIVKKVGL